MIVPNAPLDTSLKMPEPSRALRSRKALQPAVLDEATRGQIYRQWRRGVSLELLAQQYGQSVVGVERLINEMRANRILENRVDYVYDASFDEPGAESLILAPLPGSTGAGEPSASKSAATSGLPPYLASLYSDATLLTHAQESHLFRAMNYLKHRACKLREALVPAQANKATLDEIERLQEEVLAIKNRLIRSNLRLVVAIAKKRVGSGGNLFELVSDGNISLIRAVEKFNFARGFKFSTYASWAIMRNFARTIPEEKCWRDRFVTSRDELFDAAADHRSNEQEHENTYRRNQEAVQGMLSRLSERERHVLISRYGLGGADPLTLEQLGKEMGVTKERVRQIESRAEEKLRKFAREQQVRGQYPKYAPADARGAAALTPD